MPEVLISWPNGVHVIGPGITLGISSDFIGPIGVGAQYRLTVTTDAEGVEDFWQESIDITQQLDEWMLGGHRSRIAPLTNSIPATGTPVHVLTQLVDGNGSLLVTGADTATWDPTVMLGAAQKDLWLNSTAGGNQGFTDTDRQLLTDASRRSLVLGEPTDLVIQEPSGPLETTLAQLFSRSTLDRLTLIDVSGGETCDQVVFREAQFWWGVIVRVTSIAEGIQFKTPDQQWTFPDLAVLRIFRGNDLLFRRGIHEPTFLCENPFQWSDPFLNLIPIFGPPPDCTLIVDWRAGCCGQVFLTKFP